MGNGATIDQIVSKPLHLEEKPKVSSLEMSVIIPHYTEKLCNVYCVVCNYKYGKYAGSKLNQEVQ